MKRNDSLFPPTIIGAAVFGLFGLAGLGGNLHLIHERRTMREELATLRGGRVSVDAGGRVHQNGAIEQIARELAREEALLAAARDRIAALEQQLPPAVESEQLRSLGEIEQLGQEAAVFLPQLVDLIEGMTNRTGQGLTQEESARAMEGMIGWIDRLEAIGELEATPAEIARFHAATLQTRLGLDGATRTMVEEQLKKEFIDLNRRQLAKPQRPEVEQDAWYRRRRTALDEASARIETLIPSPQQQTHAVGQSLYLGTGMRSQTTVGPDGHGSVVVGLALPGVGADGKRAPQ